MNLSELTETNLENLDVYELTLTDRPANEETGFLLTKEKDTDKVRSTVRTPTFSGTTTESWSRPDLEDYGYESVEDIPEDADPHPAEHSLLGEKDGETWAEISILPVVGPNGNLNKNALESAKTYAGQVEGISEDTVENAKEKADMLLTEEFDMETEQTKEELISAIAEEYEVEDEKVEDALDKIGEGVSPKAQNAVKNVLENLGTVKEEIPKEFSWVYETLAEVADVDFAVSATKSVDVDLSDDAKSVIEESVDTLKKINELPDHAKQVVNTLSEMTKEDNDILEKISEQVDKEVGDEFEKIKDKMDKLEKENQTLKKERLEKELSEKADELKYLPAEKEDLVELLKELHDSEKYEEVIEMLEQLNKESQESELFKEKGANEDKEPEPDTAEDKIDKLAQEKVEEEGMEKSEAWDEVLNENPELYSKYLEEVGS